MHLFRSIYNVYAFQHFCVMEEKLENAVVFRVFKLNANKYAVEMCCRRL